MQFKLGKPFKPFEQLMGVLPDRSKSLVPQPYWVGFTFNVQFLIIPSS